LSLIEVVGEQKHVFPVLGGVNILR
jgi:hypothetical protein